MADETNKSNGEAARPARVIGIAIFFNPDDENMSVWTERVEGAEQAPIAMAQMMLDEASRQLDIARRMANGKALALAVQQEQHEQKIKAALSHGMRS